MNPIWTRFLQSVALRFVTFLGGVLVTHGALTPDQANMVIGPTVELIVGLVLTGSATAFGLLRAYWDKQKLTTALALPPMSEKQLDKKIASGVSAPVATPTNEQPVATKSRSGDQ